MEEIIKELAREKARRILLEETLFVVRSQLFDAGNKETVLTTLIDLQLLKA